ncbi:MAG TPA: hypothetical protein VF075_07185 [Pyrinomonadaceae bacterium]
MAEPTRARKFDEFGSVGHCDVTARLDNLAIELQNTPSARGHIISYAPPGMGERLLELLKGYLVETRGLRPARIATTYGGRNSDLTQPKIELWIVPRGAASPAPQKYDTDVETFKGLLLDQVIGDDFGVQYEAEMGPGIGGTARPSFADILHQQKNAIGYIVVYSGEDATPGAWRHLAEDEIEYLKPYNVEASRLKVIFGGRQKETKVQLWIAPKDEPPPVRDAGPESPLEKTVKAGDFYIFGLNDKQSQINFFKRLTDVLRTEKTARAFLVVRLDPPTADVPIADVEPVDETEDVDLTKLVESWRAELLKTDKIGPDRFIVLFTTTRETESSQLSLWIVPKGQPLPDPNEDEEEPAPAEPQEQSPRKL